MELGIVVEVRSDPGETSGALLCLAYLEREYPLARLKLSILIYLPHWAGQDEPHVVMVADTFRSEAVCWTQRHRK